jgi:xylulokinase
MWIRDHQPELYERTYKFLHWSAFVAFMLGAEATVDFSLANRTLLFDLESKSWSDELLGLAGIERSVLPQTVPSGTVIGQVSDQMATELGLPDGVKIVSGAHDQNANAVGCGVIEAGKAVYSMGTFLCITPVFIERRAPNVMIERGINTEHHAVPGQYVCFLYNQGGSLVKWYRDTFAAVEHQAAEARGESVYPQLLAETPSSPSGVLVLPHFTTTGPPQFISDSCGVILGLRLETQRGEILKGILEGSTFYLKDLVDSLPPTGIAIEKYIASGGGSRSDIWLQVCADILGIPFTRSTTSEAGALGSAIIAGVGCGIFESYAEGVEAMVRYERTFEPDLTRNREYAERYSQYQQLWPLMGDYLRAL